ncbi:MAG: hypothetical protein ABSE18_04280 [Minisyncoccia bacterium]|jgi:hypothetical protein
MKKITVLKEEGVAEVIDRVLDEPDEEIVLVVPTGSVLGRSVRNFHLLKREASAEGKTVVVESVDETILAFAKESGLEGNHPLWRGVRGAGGVSDIVPVGEEAGETRPPKKHGRKKAEGTKLVVRGEPPVDGGESDEGEVAEEAVAIEEAEHRFFRRRSPAELAEPSGREEEEEEEEVEKRVHRSMPRKFVVWGPGVVILVLIILGVMTWYFGRVTIAIDFQKTPWTYSGALMADKSVTTTTQKAGVITIPAQIFSAQKNTTQLFPASGSANVSIRAQGTITIYNAYSSSKQDLVATTRFVTPDGKLFRLVSGVTVPGAQVTNGAIVPSSIDTQVVADQPGADYNVGPVDKLTIPGFQGSPKYNAFYGQLKNGTSGGFVGAKAVPTAADIASAKTKVTSLLQASLASNIATSYPSNFKILDGATNISVTKLTANTSTDSNGNFSVFGEASLQAIGFDESALKAYFLAQAETQTASLTFGSIPSLQYGGVHADFTKGTVSFSVTGEGSLEPAFDADAFKASIAGKSINDARQAIAALPELADGKISAWPMWLWNIPSDPNKIRLTVD